MAMTNEEVLALLDKAPNEIASGAMAVARARFAALIARNAELEAALRLALPTVEHMYHTNPDPDGSLWADVVACRGVLAQGAAE